MNVVWRGVMRRLDVPEPSTPRADSGGGGVQHGVTNAAARLNPECRHRVELLPDVSCGTAAPSQTHAAAATHDGCP